MNPTYPLEVVLTPLKSALVAKDNTRLQVLVRLRAQTLQQFAVVEGSPSKVSLQMKPQGDMRYVLPPPLEKLSPINP